MGTQPPPLGLRETVSVIRYGNEIRILGESFKPINLKAGDNGYDKLDEALQQIGK